jgi:hypothetical protein
MPDIRRYLVIAVIAILFTILVQVSIEAAYPEPKYEDYCKPEYRPKPIMTPPPNYQCPNYNPPPMISEECERQKGYVQYRTDQYGCATEAYCETCQHKLDDAREKYNFVVFIVSALMGLIALVIGLNLSQETNPINEWVGSGFLLGGIISVFVGTIRYFGDMGRYMRPVVIFIELVLVIYLAYKRLGSKTNKKGKSK